MLGAAASDALTGAAGGVISQARGGGGGVKVRARTRHLQNRRLSSAAMAAGEGGAAASLDVGTAGRPSDIESAVNDAMMPGVSNAVRPEDEDEGEEELEEDAEFGIGMNFPHGAAATGEFSNPLFNDLPPEFGGFSGLGSDAGVGYPGALDGFDNDGPGGPGFTLPNRLASYRMLDKKYASQLFASSRIEPGSLLFSFLLSFLQYE